MSIARILRYLLGALIAAILLAVVLPFVGVPSSHFLPPAHVWGRATGLTRGVITDRYYDVTNNPFDVGGKLYFIDYRFRAKSPGPHGEPDAGPPQVYTGTVEVAHEVYQQVKLSVDQNTADKFVARTKEPAADGQVVKIQYEKTYPYINGIISPLPAYGRNIGEGSNSLSGWIMWVVLAFALGYVFMMLFERFSNKENL